MELKGEEGSLVSNSTFREPSETLDRQHHHQQNPSAQKFTGSSFKPVSIAPIRSVRYRECLKNHAASVGGNVLDGCGEFMPSGDDGTFEALKCAACNCHRNFHRKEIDHGGEAASAAVHPLRLPPPLPSPSLKQRMSVSVHANHWTSFLSPVKMTFAGGGSESSSDDLNFNNFQLNAAAPPPPPPPPYVLSKKRFRTKFTPEQKNKMLEFAEKVGWRIPREDDVEVQRFCAEVGVKRQVFKVWMHNNKNSTKKQIQQEEP